METVRSTSYLESPAGGLRDLKAIDSHTEGEPTRVVIQGFPDLGSGPIVQRLTLFATNYDHYRRGIIREPHGSEAMVGALLLEPTDRSNAAGVIFFNNVGYLGMCGHGTIGLVKTLQHMGRIGAGQHRIETPVGVVTATIHQDGLVTVLNVPSYRTIRDLAVDVQGLGPIKGDVAWGGNWFFVVQAMDIHVSLGNVDRLVGLARMIRRAVNAQGLGYVDHIELVGPPRSPDAHASSFVLCPGNSYDRSPCGTGLSAHLACLAADNRLDQGQIWVQEGILGGRFCGSYKRLEDGRILPSITGSAHITAELTLLLDETDPLCWGPDQ